MNKEGTILLTVTLQTPESDVSLDFSVDRSAHESTPRRHEITLCNVDDSVQEAEEEV